mmetsp:Transcript_43922/g.61045  ORF Transcript_43922/g.61045 Transcript_43922/m.61045 type:complete len:104 (+) Transcript_43922:175-486(+)
MTKVEESWLLGRLRSSKQLGSTTPRSCRTPSSLTARRRYVLYGRWHLEHLDEVLQRASDLMTCYLNPAILPLQHNDVQCTGLAFQVEDALAKLLNCDDAIAII